MIEQCLGISIMNELITQTWKYDVIETTLLYYTYNKNRLKKHNNTKSPPLI